MHDSKRYKILYINVVIPLIHHKNSGYTEHKVLGVYLSPAAGGERYTTLNYPFVYRIFSWCAKGIVIYINIIKRLLCPRAFGVGASYFVTDM